MTRNKSDSETRAAVCIGLGILVLVAFGLSQIAQGYSGDVDIEPAFSLSIGAILFFSLSIIGLACAIRKSDRMGPDWNNRMTEIDRQADRLKAHSNKQSTARRKERAELMKGEKR